jgi:hypothetical protein
MSSQENIFKTVRSLILQTVDQDIFLPENIKQGFIPPSGDKFISFVALPAKKTGVRGYNKYDSDNNTVTNIILFSNLIQVDFYSDVQYHASDAARRHHQYLTSFAQEVLNDSDDTSNYSIGVIDEVNDLTEFGDKAKYLYRFVVRYELFSHEQITLPQAFFDNIDLTPVIVL